MNLFKRALALLLCLVCLALCACGNSGTPVQTTTTVTEDSLDADTPLCDGKTLKVLAITSSFGLNTTQLLYDVAVAEGCTDVVIGRLYGSGCTLEKHVSNAQTGAAYYQYTKNTGSGWKQMEGINLLYGLQDEDWDIIFIQQSAAQAGQIDSYKDYIDTLMDYVKENKTNPNARFVWNMTWAYQTGSDKEPFPSFFKGDQMYQYEKIIECVNEKVLTRTDFSAIIPSGTVIQNARTSFFGDNLTKDTYHLNNLGGALAAYGMYATLTGKPLDTINLDIVSASNSNGIGGAEKILDPFTDEDKAVIIESVNNAIANPYCVTVSQYPG